MMTRGFIVPAAIIQDPIISSTEPRNRSEADNTPPDGPITQIGRRAVSWPGVVSGRYVSHLLDGVIEEISERAQIGAE
jgi:hypothetical protein